ncbi:MOSC domain-containing protein [Enterobacteriaceae bacterium 4M9]|nr:MOSC domain-containing protein [Enterobacteriaceae bacterium 4M9]
MLSLSRLYIHPVKSMRGLRISHARADVSGLNFDRVFMLTETDGTFVTARQHPEMVLFTPVMLEDGLWLGAPDGSEASVRFADFSTIAAATEVWGNHFTALIAPPAINQWLSTFFKCDVQLRWVGPTLTRRVKAHDAVPLGFADGFPYLLTSEASLRDLQKRCPAGVRMEQFRPNLVVAGAEPWDEDRWRVVRIGSVIFDVVKPCTRCVLTTVNPEQGRKHGAGEPLATLQRFRASQDGNVNFGQNLIARNSGLVRVGDEFEVLETGDAPVYGAGIVEETLTPPSEPGAQFSLQWNDQQFPGNNQQPLLEQLENQGIRVSWSCRAGVCGCCRIRLLEGEVKALKKSAVAEDGTILCCSCIPAGPLRLSEC